MLFRYQLVWNETIRVYKDMVAGEEWAKKDVIDIPIVQKLTFKVCTRSPIFLFILNSSVSFYPTTITYTLLTVTDSPLHYFRMRLWFTLRMVRASAEPRRDDVAPRSTPYRL